MNKTLKLGGGLLLLGACAAAGWKLAQQQTGTVADDGAQMHADSGAEGKTFYTCAMHPQIHLDHAGNCPICGMALVQRQEAAPSTQATDNGIVSIDPRMAQNLGMRTAEVRSASVAPVLEAVGSVQLDERSVITVQARTAGWIDKLAVNAVGDRVEQGQVLATLYSPELYAAQQEQALARDSGDRSLLAAAQQRFELLGGGKGQGSASTIRAPAAGVVTSLDVRSGAQLSPGATLMTLADLSRVWIQIEVPESAATQITVGATAEARLSAEPQQVFRGTVDYLYPTLDSQTRTLRARLVFDNPQLRLKPGMYARVSLSAAAGPASLWVPSEAVIRTGARTVVIVAEAEGRYRPVNVEAGAEQGGETAIRSGLEAGQRVVVSGQFLIDSEASLQGSALRTNAGDSP